VDDDDDDERANETDGVVVRDGGVRVNVLDEGRRRDDVAEWGVEHDAMAEEAGEVGEQRAHPPTTCSEQKRRLPLPGWLANPHVSVADLRG